jgi:DNA-binding transcriptional ArsR family regulator
MNVNSIGRLAALIGEAGRIQMLTLLLDGGHPASELAMAAAVSPQTASSHLAKLLSGGLVVCERRGRQRIFRLKDADVAAAIEALAALAPDEPVPAVPELRFARTCYDHLAGRLAIAVRDKLLKRDFLKKRGDLFALSPAGNRFFNTFDIDAESLLKQRRSFSRTCMDWTERRHHIGGSLGSALLSRFMEMKWLARMRQTRAVRVTPEGERGFERVFGIPCETLRS